MLFALAVQVAMIWFAVIDIPQFTYTAFTVELANEFPRALQSFIRVFLILQVILAVVALYIACIAAYDDSSDQRKKPAE
jgi:uncharacterized membrane protein